MVNLSGIKKTSMGNKSSKPPNLEAVEKFIQNVRPLDLLVFVGGDSGSNVIQCLQKLQTKHGEVSHTELAISRELCTKIKPLIAPSKKEDSDELLYSWGSTLSGKLNDGVLNSETGSVNFGVQTRVLYDLCVRYLEHKTANIGVMRLKIDILPDFDKAKHLKHQYKKYKKKHIERLTVRSKSKYRNSKREYKLFKAEQLKKQKKLQRQLNRTYDKFHSRTYEKNPIALLASLYPGLRPLRDLFGTNHQNSVFCSEFVAEVYNQIGVLQVSAENVIPVDFIEDKDGEVPKLWADPIWLKPNLAKNL